MAASIARQHWSGCGWSKARGPTAGTSQASSSAWSAPRSSSSCRIALRAECHSGLASLLAFVASPATVDRPSMDLMLPARDGVKLAATLFEPSTPNGMAILLNSGTGIPRRFYGAFAQHLSDRGFAVLTYDYRGIGQSNAPSSAAVEHWGAVDQSSVIDHLARLRPGAPLGHSFGGQVLGLADNIAGAAAAGVVLSPRRPARAPA